MRGKLKRQAINRYTQLKAKTPSDIQDLLKKWYHRAPSSVTDFIESHPRAVAFGVLGGMAASFVGIHSYTHRHRDYYATPPTVKKAWTEIGKVSESDSTAMLRHQYTDFGSTYRGIMRLGARVKLGLPKNEWEYNIKTVFQKNKEYFKPGGYTELTPFSKIRASRKELVDIAPTTEGNLVFRPGPENLPGMRLTAEIEKKSAAVAMENSIASMTKPTRVPTFIDEASGSWLKYRRVPAKDLMNTRPAKNPRLLQSRLPIHPDAHLVLGVNPIKHTNHSPFRHNHLFSNKLGL
jgi:hypothetical protein